MTILWFWAFLVAAPFGLAACHQAAEPGWKLVLGAFSVAAVGLGYIIFGFPDDMLLTKAQFDRHPDQLKFLAVSWVVVAAVVCLAGAMVGRVFRSRTTPAGLGFSAFLVAFIGMNMIVITGAFA